MRVRTVIVIIVITALAFITSQGYALESFNYPAGCVDSRYRDTLFPDMNGDCHMNIDDKITVHCRVYPDVCVICSIFECLSREESGSKLIECKEIWPKEDMTKVVVFTEEEFLDTQTRCTRICGNCPTKWIPGKVYRVVVPDDQLRSR
jgi:hypothetical protein